MLCGSGLRAVVTACQAIQCGSSDLVVAGGQESMSLAPHLLHMRRPVKFGDRTAQDSLISKHMGVTAENVARRYGVSRQDQDNFACLSQNKAEKAQRSDLFKEELLPAAASAVGSDPQEPLLRQDEFPRHGTTVEGLKSLKPSFQKDAEATVTAGNSSGINDGPPPCCSPRRRRLRNGACRVVSYGQAGVEPDYMGMGPVPAIRKALSRAGWSTKDVDLFELNEAFAAQAVAVCSELDLDRARLNVCGGAIALGHPIGCSGARILVTLAHQMRRLSARRGCAAACIGGGMASPCAWSCLRVAISVMGDCEASLR
uniref:Thiolase_N domain-containing protein n=1 Tax=Macrostomum lignano TaxID=282301 RepID=A0A1I8F8F8_9PLAT